MIDCKTNMQYGLNSYYLFPKQPVFDSHIKALKQMELLLRKISRTKKLYKNSPLKSQHTFYIPVSFSPQSWVQAPQEADFAAAARWVLHNYDYQCASKLLALFPSATGKGPYIFSSTKKLSIEEFGRNNSSNISSLRIPTLVQDFSNIESSKSTFWLDTFFKKSWQPRQWQAKDLVNIQENLLERLLSHELQQKESTVVKIDISENTPMIIEAIPASPAQPLAPSKFSNRQQYPVNDLPRPVKNLYAKKITIKFIQEIEKRQQSSL